jgi:hypothetical protein
MVRSAPKQQRRIQEFLVVLSAGFLTLVPGAVRAQQNAAHPAPVVAHPSGVARALRPVPMTARPVAGTGVQPLRRPMAGWPASAGRYSTARRADVGAPVSVESRSGRSEGPFLRPFFFGGASRGGFGGGAFSSDSGALPLGFGLWPACDSAAIPGVFSSVGPCFGIGDYSAEGGATESASSGAPGPYLLPLFFGEAPESGTAPQENASASAAVPTALLYRTDGSTVTASDWWVARGRLQYITDSGAAGSMNLSQLDLEQTIKQNQTRGLEFHLKFTAPSDR